MLPLELWTGLVELRPLKRAKSQPAGAFTNIVTWARDADEFRIKAETIAATLEMFVADVEKVAPVGNYSDDWPSAFEDLVRRARSNPNAIIYGTFHNYRRDEG